ncbi:MAG TPA: hypothetical protein DIS95_06040 [Proteus vulgaris]|nr:hypothetical protein [Proteus vulgaris]
MEKTVQMKKIAIIIPTLNIAGAEKLATSLANEYSKKNETSIIVLFKSKGKDLKKQVNKEVKLIQLDKNNNIYSKLTLPFILFKLIKKEKFNIIHTHLSTLFYLFPFAKLLNKKNIKIFHTIHNIAKKDANKINQYTNNFLFKNKIATPVAISEEIQKTVFELYNYHSPVIHNGSYKAIKTDKFSETENTLLKLKTHRYKKIICSIARLTPQKNHNLLIECAKERSDILFICLGDWGVEEQEYAKKIIESMRHTDNIKYIGVKNNVSDYLMLSDAIIFTSLYEGLPISLLEAISIGKPCITTAVGGIPDLITPECGYITSSINDKNSILSLIDKWQRDSEDELNKKKNILINIFDKKFSIENCANKYLTLFDKK